MRDTKVDSSTEKSEEIKFKKEENREFIITLIVYIISSLLIFLFIAEKFNSISPMTTVGYFFEYISWNGYRFFCYSNLLPYFYTA